MPTRYNNIMQRKATRLVLLSQLCLNGFLLVCTLLMPQFLFERDEGGVSNFGVHALTVVPFSLAFGLGGALLLLAVRGIPRRSKTRQRELQSVLSLLGALLFLVLVTTYPYKVNRFFDNLHIAAAILLFVAELAAGAWFAVSRNDTLNLTLFAVQIVGSLAALLTLAGVLHVLFVAQLLAGLSFGALLVRTVSQMLAE
jgi:uncharacterized membrane protein